MKRIRTAMEWRSELSDGSFYPTTRGTKSGAGPHPVCVTLIKTADYRRLTAELREARKQLRYCGECIAPKQKARKP